ncbi:MAG: copper tolerance protein [marine bacterium B5-7]|nr:MAG: copper tolerance protein [marine bacterium B5-7]
MIFNGYPKGMVLATSLVTILTTNAYAHSGETHSSQTYDPVNTEFGTYDPSYSSQRTVDVSMNDNMRFEPQSIEVTAGEVVHFRIRNDGSLLHEFVLGTNKSLHQHADMMRTFPQMEHDEPYMAHVPAGEVVDIVWKFDKAGELGFACLLPGHYEAGMKGKLSVR